MSDTLLDYAVLTTPAPLQAATPATLTLVASNGTRRVVVVESIVVTLPVGVNAKDLVADPAGIEVRPQLGWSGSITGGEIRLTPDTPEAAKVGTGGLSFMFAAVRVNDQPGTTRLTVDETAAFEGEDPEDTSTDLALAKFPLQFQVSELTASSLTVDAGASATLQWAGTRASYRMQYSPGNGAPAVDVPVESIGPYVSQALYQTPYVVFTLVVSVSVPGQDQPLVLQRQLTVGVRALSIDRFDALPAIVPVLGVARLTWRTTQAVSVTLQPGNRALDLNGSLYLSVPGTQTFTLIAVGADSGSTTQQRTITVDPSITVNTDPIFVPGPPGQQGPAGRDSRGGPPGPGGAGGWGGPSPGGSFQLGPLDLTGTTGRVRGVLAPGGDGGRGGRGGNADSGFQGGDGGPGGFGGSGGYVMVTIASSGTAAQLVVDVSGGKRGEGGDGGSGSPAGGHGSPGNPGRPGSVTFAAPALFNLPAVRRHTPAPSNTRLGYALLEEPEEDGTTTLSLSVHGEAEVETISVPLPVLSRPDGWTAAEDDGATTLTPPPAGLRGSATFTFAPVTHRPAITIHEKAGGETRTATFAAEPPAGS